MAAPSFFSLFKLTLWNFKRQQQGKNWQHALGIQIAYSKISLSTSEKEMLGLDQVNHETIPANTLEY